MSHMNTWDTLDGKRVIEVMKCAGLLNDLPTLEKASEQMRGGVPRYVWEAILNWSARVRHCILRNAARVFLKATKNRDLFDDAYWSDDDFDARIIAAVLAVDKEITEKLAPQPFGEGTKVCSGCGQVHAHCQCNTKEKP